VDIATFMLHRAMNSSGYDAGRVLAGFRLVYARNHRTFRKAWGAKLLKVVMVGIVRRKALGLSVEVRRGRARRRRRGRANPPPPPCSPRRSCWACCTR
jgi:hypothetical protein